MMRLHSTQLSAACSMHPPVEAAHKDTDRLPVSGILTAHGERDRAVTCILVGALIWKWCKVRRPQGAHSARPCLSGGCGGWLHPGHAAETRCPAADSGA